MEHIDALTANDQRSADTQNNDDRSSSEPTSTKPTIAKLPTEAPLKLKTSERRRIQNRQAQKTYREKQKKRLQALESLAKSKTLAQDAPASGTPSATIGQDMAGILAADSPIMGLSGMVQPQELGPAAGMGMGSLVGCGTTFNAAALSYQTAAPAPMYRYAPDLDFQQADATLNPGRSFREDLFSASNPLVAQSGSTAIAPGVDLDSPSLQQVAPGHTIAQDGQLAERDDTDSLLAQFLLQDDTALTQPLLMRIRKNKITLKDVLRRGLQSLERDSQNSTKPAESSMQGRVVYKQMQVQLPDLHTNTIRVTQMSFVAAVLHNATMLGVTATEMFEYESDSPFCTPRKTPDTSTDGLAFTDIKDDLKPTQNQLTQRHHPYIDALPFRAFRERLIALMYAEPPIINREELCHDLQSDGVICWGSFAGAGTGHSGAPWDIRSWEVRPWFLKKYWMITEGAQGEMYQQARWWCELRGEDVPTLW
ncbi:hypothetical protein TgHK011_003268 [Trichoderma gracile]|nr:hypothetical protein TgHK011_003268 [Trichoderma gracile]